jgi:ligand-binding sensor domain-containing protein/signal transduction histidine kinase
VNPSSITLVRRAASSIVLFLPWILHAQQSDFQHIGIDEGLSQDIVTSIAQDSLGFMWFGTEDGLNKYDGYSMTVLKHKASDPNSLPSNIVTGLLLDPRGRMWIATSRGIRMVEPDGRFIAVSQPADGYGVFCRGVDGDFWISTGSALYRSAPDGRLIRASTYPIRWSGANVMHFDRHQRRLFVGSESGLRVFSVSKDTLRLLQNTGGADSLRGQTVTALCWRANGELFVGTREQGLFQLDSNLSRATRYRNDARDAQSLSDNRVMALVEDLQHHLWVGTFSGLDRFDETTEKFVRYTPEANGLRGDRVYSLYVERNGALWVGTYRGGVNRLDVRRGRFGHVGYQHHAGALRAKDVFSLLETHDGDLWVGTDRGLFRRQHGTDHFRPYNHDARDPRSLSSSTVFSLFQRRNGEIWIGGADGVVSRFEAERQDFVHYQLPVVNAVRVIYETTEGSLLVGTESRGAFALNPVTHRFDHWQVRVDSVYTSAGVWAMHQDRSGFLWLGTFYLPYILRIDPRTQIAVKIVADPEHKDRLLTPLVRAFCELGNNALYLGTWGGGLARYDRSSDRYRWYTEDDGMSNNYVKSMQSDEHGRIWIATEKGLVRYDPQTELFKTYTVEDGLQSNFFWSGSSCKGKDGMLYFGGTNGFNAFHPDSILDNLEASPVVITSMRVLDRPLPIPDTRIVTLAHDADFFSFEFVALDYSVPFRNQYAYKLDGFDRDWVNAGTRRYAAYTHLDPGTYVFNVKASNADGVWSVAGASIAVTILPPFWATWWFRSAMVLAVVAVLYGMYRYRLNQLLSVERLRQRIAQDLHDDIGTNLSAIVVASQVIHQQQRANSDVLHQVTDIGGIALRTQELMRNIVWMLNPKNDTLQEFVGRMKHECVLLFQGITYSFSAPGGNLPGRVTLDFKRNVFLIYKEALNNIVKHAGATRVDVRIEFVNDLLIVQIHDNGVGFDPGNPHRGSGLVNMRARADRLGASLRILSSPGEGSTIELRAQIA